MDFLSRLEQTLEHTIEGIFTRAFRAQIQPIEIAKRLGREMDARRAVSVAHVYAPNDFTGYLSPADLESFAPFLSTLLPEVERYLADRARASGYQLLGGPRVLLDADPAVRQGEMRIDARTLDLRSPAESGQMELTTIQRPGGPTLEVVVGPNQGAHFRLERLPALLGRASDNEIRLNDPGISRRHARIETAGDSYLLRDLGSTNGTFVADQRIANHRLQEGDRIRLGSTVLIFHQAAPHG